ncbi:hypothetical protein RZS08_12895, partial [Arthrospira platensis SPKY1]|nr:hypothetical protein [Arthrospira platensis SPKY1]
MNTHALNGAKEGYSDYYNNQVVIADGAETVLNFSMSPLLGNAALRFVLSWSANPRDLDSHVQTPSINGRTYHVYYSSRGDSAAAPYVRLDHDITSGYGPETVTFTRLFEGTYHYYVYNYSGSPDMTTSEALVQIYGQSGLLYSVRIPESGTGRYWH